MDNGSVFKALQNLDQFRVVSRELTRGTLTGGVFTAIAYAILILLMIAELGAYFRTTYQTIIIMDRNQENLMQINFDITMLDLPCRHLDLGVYDKFGREKLDQSVDYSFTPIGHQPDQGRAYSAEEIKLLEEADEQRDVTEDEAKELDSDWSSTSDHFHHHDFHHAVTFHDFTVVNFFAEWCVHCRRFFPVWVDMASKVSEKRTFVDGDGRETTVKFLKMNCVAFGESCQQEAIRSFPTIRLYKRTGSFEAFRAKREPENIMKFLEESIRNSHAIVARHHSMFTEACQVRGSIRVPRVPGHMHINAVAKGDENVNPALTNVSHLVNHFSFGDKDAHHFAERLSIPKDMLAHVTPMDKKRYIVERFHEAPQHYLKVVSTYVHGREKAFYQMTHTQRIRKLKRESKAGLAPQARLTWDFSPMSVKVRAQHRPWYEFITSLFAILGGTYTIVELCSGAADSVGAALKEAMGKKS